jgi:hypothetical protein
MLCSTTSAIVEMLKVQPTGSMARTAAMGKRELVRLATALADSLERQHQAVSAGIVRQLAREVATPSGIGPDVCACGCGTPLLHPRVGRRRRWVDESHRRRARRR